MSAAKAAVDCGVVAGGGTALLRASVVLAPLRDQMPEDEWNGLNAVHFACYSIAKQNATNAGIPWAGLYDQLMATPNLGSNAFTGEFENLIESGIIDPVKVVIESLRNAVAVACSIITMGATISEKPIERPTNV